MPTKINLPYRTAQLALLGVLVFAGVSGFTLGVFAAIAF